MILIRFVDTPKMAWLTVNRDCNMRCKWCYAQGTGYQKASDMSLENAKKALAILSELGIHKVVLIGGEPTKHPHLEAILSACADRGIHPSLITNGLDLANRDFLQALVARGLRGVNLSIKGDTREAYIENTRVDCFEKIMEAIGNLIDSKLHLTVSYVLTNDNIDGLFHTCMALKRMGVSSFYFSFCNPYFQGEGVNDYHVKPFALMEKWMAQADLLIEHDIKFNFHATMPLCAWPRDFIDKLKRHRCISTTCQLQNRSGIIFDTQLNLIACNSLYQYPYGTYGEDYTDAGSLRAYLRSPKVTGSFKQLLRAPSDRCILCEDFSVCAGGCILQWFSYSFDDLMKEKEAHHVHTALGHE